MWRDGDGAAMSEYTPTTEDAVYICGGDYRPSPRSQCPHSLHDWPLPAGYGDADEVAQRRIRNGWRNTRCPKCGVYGWREGRQRGDGDTFVPAVQQEGTEE